MRISPDARSRADVLSDDNKHFPSDNGVKTHNRFWKIFHSVITIKDKDNGQKTYLNKQSCINWIKRNGGDVKGLSRFSSDSKIQAAMESVFSVPDNAGKLTEVDKTNGVDKVGKNLPSNENLLTMIKDVTEIILKNPNIYQEEGVFRIDGENIGTNNVKTELYNSFNTPQYQNKVDSINSMMVGYSFNVPYLLKRIANDFLNNDGTIKDIQENTKLPILFRLNIDHQINYSKRKQSAEEWESVIRISFPGLFPVYDKDNNKDPELKKTWLKIATSEEAEKFLKSMSAKKTDGDSSSSSDALRAPGKHLSVIQEDDDEGSDSETEMPPVRIHSSPEGLQPSNNTSEKAKSPKDRFVKIHGAPKELSQEPKISPQRQSVRRQGVVVNINTATGKPPPPPPSRPHK